MAQHTSPNADVSRLDHHAFAAMTPAEFDTFIDLAEQVIAEAGPEATVVDALHALPELDPPF